MIKEVPCLECDGKGFIAKFGEYSVWSERCPNCGGTGIVKVPVTNADRIRAMSDEELAEFLAEEQFRIANVVFQTVGYGLEKQAIYARRLDWLQQLYEGE